MYESARRIVDAIWERANAASMASGRASDRSFFCVSALLFALSAAATLVWCGAMSSMGEMPMPGGWSMSMAWMRMPGQTWLGATASFIGMWTVMTMAMMLPSLVSMLWRYRRVIGLSGDARLGCLTALAGLGYFCVWTAIGMAVFLLGVALAAVEMHVPQFARAVPFAIGATVMFAGLLQFTTWKARQLACCSNAPVRAHVLPPHAASAWRHGLRLGVQCSRCCANLMAILLAFGVMDLGAMAVLGAAVNLERLASVGERVARFIGVVATGVAIFLLARAAGLG